MSIRRTNVDRVNEARKSSIPTIGRGEPNNSQGNEGDITFRRTSSGLKLYIKANQQWQGVKVGESFESLEEKINEVKDKVDLIKKLNLVTSLNDLSDVTFGSGALTISGLTSLETTNFEIESLSTTLNSSQNIVLDAANTSGVVGGGIKLETDGHMFANFSSNSLASRFELYQKGGTEPDAGDTSLDRLAFDCLEHGSSRITAIDASGANLANLRIRAFGNLELQATNKVKFSQDGNSGFENYISPFASTLIFG